MFVTNFTSEEISNLVKMQLEDMATWNVQSYAVSGESGMAETYSWKGQELSITWPDENTVRHAKALIDRVMDGETLSAEDMILSK